MAGLISKLLNERGVLLADGATGSNLFDMGLQTGDSPELWNVTHPDRVTRLCQSFVDAGSDIVLTNSFGGNRYRLKLHDAADRVRALNMKAAQIARQQIRQSGRDILLGGSMGPTGEIFQPLGSLSIEEAAVAFAEQAEALKEGGVDMLWLETMSSKEEVQAAVLGGSKTALPIVATFSIDTNGRTMMGLSPADIVRICYELDTVPFALGVNCGVGASESIAAVINVMHALSGYDFHPIVIVKANCGVPEYIDGKIVYSGTKEIMSEYTKMAVDAGARIIGGCCGTTAAHVQAMRQTLDSHHKSASPDVTRIEHKLGLVSAGAKAQLRGDMSIAGGAARGRAQRKPGRRRR